MSTKLLPLLRSESWRDLAPRVYRGLLSQLFAASPSITILSAITTAFVGGVASWRSGDPWLMALTLITFFALIAAVVEVRRAGLAKHDGTVGTLRAWERRFEILSWISSLAVGIMTARAILAHDDAVVHFMLVALCLGAATATIRYHYRPRIAFGKLCGLYVPSITAMLLKGDLYYFIIGLGALASFKLLLDIFLELYRNAVEMLGTIDEKDMLSEELRRQSAALKEANDRYDLIAQASNDASWDWDMESGQVRWNEAGARLFGKTGTHYITISEWSEHVHPADRPAVIETFWRAAGAGAERWSLDFRFRRNDGSYSDMHDRGFIIRDDEGKAIRAIGAMADLTETKRTQLNLERMQAQVMHLSRTRAMDAMASTLAHELNQPLAAIANYMRGTHRLLVDKGADGIAECVQSVSLAEAAAQRAGDIIRRLRHLVSGTGSRTIEDIGQLIAEAGSIALIDEHLHGVTHEIESEQPTRFVEVDRVQIQQVLVNLIRNAVQAMADSPTRKLIIRTRETEAEMVEVSVTDTGPGLPSELWENLFSPFHTTKPEGMGLGLSISRTIVEAHGGRIWADRCADGGATFVFTLPKATLVIPSPEEDAALRSSARTT